MKPHIFYSQELASLILTIFAVVLIVGGGGLCFLVLANHDSTKIKLLKMGGIVIVCAIIFILAYFYFRPS